MFEILPRTEGSYVAVRLTGALTEDDVLEMREYLTGLIHEEGALRILFAATEWTGWASWNALWEDVKADVTLNEHVDRLAMVGKGTLDQWMTEAMEPFARARVRWFPSSDLEEGWRWLLEAEAPGNDRRGSEKE